MKTLLLAFVSVWYFNTAVFCQNFPKAIDGKGFESIFQNLGNGDFHGQLTGKLRIVNLSGDTLNLSIDQDIALLQIIPDPDEVYDVSRKVYSCKNERAIVKYSTYAFANAIEINIDQKAYELSLIDGGCDLIIKELEFVYKETVNQETLYLFFTGNVGLYQTPNCGIPQIFIQAGSMLVFTIDKPVSIK
jgi:hypothetical protein